MKGNGTDMDKKWYYDAFISYRHTENDSFVAKLMHRQLENFKLPGNVARRLKDNDKEAKTRITRVFRDREELPLVSNLADPIMEALEKSEFLIVICSPGLKESMWCKKEIETFIKLRGREHVLLVLAQGEPSDSFPEELLYREETETLEDGSIVTKKVIAEPLAADVRGHSKREIRKKIKKEVLRLMAPMFGCGYDDLRQRHRERKMRRIIAMSLAGSLFCLIFGLVSTTMAFRIQRQNIQIVEQSEEIAMQAEKIEKQYRQAVRNNCISQAKEAANLLEKGDRISAIETALRAFPDSEGDIPYTPQAAYALTKSLNLYENNRKILPDRMLEADTTIDFIKISPDCSKIITVDDYGMLCVWDAEDGSKLNSFLLSRTLYNKAEEIAFISEDAFLYPSENGVGCFDINLGEDIYRIDCENVSGICYSKDADRAVISMENDFLVIRGKNGEVTASAVLGKTDDAEKSMKIKYGAVMNEEGSLFAVTAEQEKEQYVFVFETKTGEAYREYSVAYGSVGNMRFDGNALYISDNERWESGSLLDSDLGSTVYACDLSQDNTFLWTYKNDSGWIYKISVSSKEGSSYMVCASHYDVIALNKEDGSLMGKLSLGSDIVEIRNYVGKDAFLAFTRDGIWHYVNVEKMTDYANMSFADCNSANVKMFGIGDDYYVTLPYLDKYITLYRRAADSNMEILYENETDSLSAELSGDGEYLAVCSYTDDALALVKMIRTDTGEMIWSYKSDKYFEGMAFYNEMKVLALATGNGIILLDNETGEQKACYEKGDYFEKCHGFDEAGQYAVILNYSGMNIRNMADGSNAYEITFNQNTDDISTITISPSVKYMAAVSETADTLRLYSLDDLNGGKEGCICEMKNINATYVEYIFFNDRDECESGLTLYVVYKNGDIKRYGVDVKSREMSYGGSMCDLESCMNRFIQPEGKDYSIIAGMRSAYLIYNAWDDASEKTGLGEEITDFDNHGEISAHIEGFLAVDGEKSCVYLTDGSNIYRVRIYDEAELREEAKRQLRVKN